MSEKYCCLCGDPIPEDADPHEVCGEGEEKAHIRCAQDQ